MLHVKECIALWYSISYYDMLRYTKVGYVISYYIKLRHSI